MKRRGTLTNTQRLGELKSHSCRFFHTKSTDLLDREVQEIEVR
jgi:hypothetical protein